MSDSPLTRLRQLGQSVWLDNLTREMVKGGRLETLIRADGVSGITSNPQIFKNAITGSGAYDDQIRALASKRLAPKEIYEQLAIDDIRGAADLFRELHAESRGTNGFVSLEVSPHLARDTAGTIDEARRLWTAVDRPNVLIKIPGTAEGVPAIESCLADGINVNITLLFSLDAYRSVIDAFLDAMESRMQQGAKPNVASVASFFLSRIDTKVDRALDGLISDGREIPGRLKGRAAVASAKMAYQLWTESFSGERWRRLTEAGAHAQKPLWASTSTKNPEYSDVKYVETLIGPDTINTMPDETLAAFRDHGVAERTIELDLSGERQALADLARAGVDLNRVTDELVEEAIQKFVDPFDDLLNALEEKSRILAG